MKFKTIILAAAAIAASVACSQKAPKTTLSGNYSAEAPKEVNISIPELGIDTTVAVIDKQFSIDLPADPKQTGLIRVGREKVNFIPDGTPMTLIFNANHTIALLAQDPANSVQEKLNQYEAATKELMTNAQAQIDSLAEDAAPEAKEKIIDEYQKALSEISLKVFDENKDNAVALYALDNLQYDLPVAKLDEMLNSLDTNLTKSKNMVALRKVVNAQLATAEGQKFTDFEVGAQKFSDYVGNGKYVLVDFWASWCGPCKAELPNIKKVYNKYHGDDFDVLSIAVWDSVTATVRAAKELGIVWSQIVDAQRIPTDIYGIQGIPHIMLIGPDGTILKRDLRGADIETEVAKYVKAKR